MKGKKFLLLLPFVTAIAFPAYPSDDLPISVRSVITPRRLELTAQYSRIHYGTDSYRLKEPRMIVVHYTVTHNLEETIRMFGKDTLEGTRPELVAGGNVNVGVHFVINQDGKLYSLIPEDIIARHTIGFNNVALGIEMVGMNAQALKPAQLDACARLVAHLQKKHPSIRYLIGHQEYMIRSLPHFKLYTELDRSYKPTVKIDPGAKFLTDLRQRLEKDYSIILEK